MPLLGARRVVLLGGALSGAQRATRYGLISAWNLEEASSTRNDSVGANHLTDNNTVTTATAKLGANAAQFTAANSESLSIADNAGLSGGDVDLWIACWVLMDTKAASHYLAAKWNDTGPQYDYALIYDVTANRFRFRIRNGNNAGIVDLNATTLGVPATATWYFLLAYHDAANDLIAISGNGGAFDTTAATLGVRDSTAAFTLGAQSDSLLPHDGRLDAAAFGKSPVGGIANVAAELRDYLYAGGVGREWPWL